MIMCIYDVIRGVPSNWYAYSCPFYLGATLSLVSLSFSKKFDIVSGVLNFSLKFDYECFEGSPRFCVRNILGVVSY